MFGAHKHILLEVFFFLLKSAAFETASGLQTFCQDNKTTAAFASTQAYLVLAEKSVLQFSVIDFTQDVEM